MVADSVSKLTLPCNPFMQEHTLYIWHFHLIEELVNRKHPSMLINQSVFLQLFRKKTTLIHVADQEKETTTIMYKKKC